MKVLFMLTAFLAAVVAISTALPESDQFKFALNEDSFEKYHYAIQKNEITKEIVADDDDSGCTIRVNGDLGQPQPVYLHNGNFMVPTRNTGLIHLDTGDQVYIACTGSGRVIQHSNITVSTAKATATCVRDGLFSGDGWLDGYGSFGGITCSAHVYHYAEATNDTCYNNNILIRVGFIVDDEFYPVYWSCFDQSRLEVLYVRYEQNPPNAIHQSGVDRPGWLAGTFYPGVAVNGAYTQVSHKQMIASFVGAENAEKYVTSTQFISRGHLAAKADFIFATAQRASFYFINAAPQWLPFNSGNWNWLEQSLRARVGQAGYHTTIYTGTFGVTQLRNETNHLVDIYLHRTSDGTLQIPIPLYFYKVVHDASRRLGTAFVSINNPYYTQAEVEELQFCTDHCRNNSAFDWLRWQADNIDLGYSFCCTIADFTRVVPHLPPISVDGLLS